MLGEIETALSTCDEAQAGRGEYEDEGVALSELMDNLTPNISRPFAIVWPTWSCFVDMELVSSPSTEHCLDEE